MHKLFDDMNPFVWEEMYGKLPNQAEGYKTELLR